MSSVSFANTYRTHSRLVVNDEQQVLQLAASNDSKNTSIFFDGNITKAYETARCLRFLSKVVGARFYIPPAMLARILREADPVVTAAHNQLRFEVFSSCCSAYARLDIPNTCFSASKVTTGTTNVDFGQEMRAALSHVRKSDNLTFNVSQNGFSLESSKSTVFEKKVTLPVRWIKGFSEVQAMQVDATKFGELSRVEAIKLFRQLPRNKNKEYVWLTRHGKSIRIAHQTQKHGIKLKGIERLNLIAELLPICNKLEIYSTNSQSLSCWVLHIGDLALTYVLSAEPWRGFSGEGNLLKALVAFNNDALLANIKAELNWQSQISIEVMSQQLGVSKDDIQQALSILATRGLVGFDVNKQCFFHRVLRFDLDLVDQLNPRFKSAAKLVDKSAVLITEKTDTYLYANVQSNKITHRVEITSEQEKCTCPWYGKYKGDRGPCKHILATLMILEEQGNDSI
ncbi:hypothetical protein AN214_01012 [Pseudoalteromonas sp. P1-9]|uniref:SWIM zinc finger family protein n=1 Tax=Pseudoalteromonas sp. P1-9 TaxID=1710354 RepID=UPI0006D64BC0|nr:SWIM zinc finger family protein [Pseudoalteromonas sp. P1-9]KPV96995.1 hypothetical protein AN214_01012 [Pseudoalteromonas sp. P1-9]